MSKRNKKHKDDKIFNVVIIILLLFVLTPTIPLCLIFLALYYFFNTKVKYVLIGNISIALILVIQQNIIRQFIIEFIAITSALTQKIFLQSNIWALLEYKNYSLSSWLVILLLSNSIANYFLYQMQKRKKYEKAGIKQLEKGIDEMNKSIPTPKKEKCNDEKCTLLGTNKNHKKIYCQDNAKHVFISGTTGSGKTVAISNFIASALQKKYGMLLVDGKGDTSENSMLKITTKLCQQYKRKLYLINMNEPETSSKYNPFKNANATITKDMLINMSQWTEEHYKLNTERYLQRLINLLKLQDEEIDLQKIVNNISEDNFKELSKKLLEIEKISKIEHIQNDKLIKNSASIAQDASARFATILESSIGQIFSVEGIDIYTALKENAVILFILNPLLYPETSQAMGRLTLIDAKKAVSKLYTTKTQQTFFIFDEINVYADSTLIDLVNKSRSADITCILATQSLSDLENAQNEAFKNQIIENCNNYVIMRQNTFKSAEEWAKTIGTHEQMKMTYKIDEESNTGKGSARINREFIVHPDEIKNQQTAQAIFVSKDISQIERIQVNKPF